MEYKKWTFSFLNSFMHQSANFPISLSRLIYDAESALREAETATEDKCECWVWNESSYEKLQEKPPLLKQRLFWCLALLSLHRFGAIQFQVSGRELITEILVALCSLRRCFMTHLDRHPVVFLNYIYIYMRIFSHSAAAVDLTAQLNILSLLPSIKKKCGENL